MNTSSCSFTVTVEDNEPPTITCAVPAASYNVDQMTGTYTVVGWYEGEARTQRAVTVTAGAVTDLELVVP